MGIVDEILDEIYKRTDKMLWHIAQTSNIAGYDAEDLMQEMRIKIWKVIKDNKYDPELCKETTFFYKVCKRHLIDLNKAKIYRYCNTPKHERRHRDQMDMTNIRFSEVDELGCIPKDFADHFSDEFIDDFF
jgi:RNA polymerase sigma factor (sigma-70 family)